eukprot:228222-Amorphochlora_amoeboformis.AAC.1
MRDPRRPWPCYDAHDDDPCLSPRSSRLCLLLPKANFKTTLFIIQNAIKRLIAYSRDSGRITTHAALLPPLTAINRSRVVAEYVTQDCHANFQPHSDL